MVLLSRPPLGPDVGGSCAPVKAPASAVSRLDFLNFITPAIISHTRDFYKA